MSAKTHWESIYSSKKSTEVSWYQTNPHQSLEFIRRAAQGNLSSAIIDVGGGASTLVDYLLDDGFTDITVMDISASALSSAQARLGERANHITWLDADVTKVDLPLHQYDIWHDRAVFHFLTKAEDRQRYLKAVMRAVKPEGMVIIATFADDGPTKCSGLDVMRYSPPQLHAEFGDGFKLLESVRETHHTPFGTNQQFVYCLCQKLAPEPVLN
jgi:2-polyprenyl-3-methyl-5-hydroxy-6-metoxy-1,4-benzoquinol methylase